MPVRIRDLEAKLATAQRHVVRGQVIVATQRERVRVLKGDGHQATAAEEILALFLATQATFEEHERQLLESADQAVRIFSETKPLWLDPAADPECPDPAQSMTNAIIATGARRP